MKREPTWRGSFWAAILVGLIIFAAWLLGGCATIRNLNADSRRVAVCDVTRSDQVEALNVRPGYPFLSAPHRYTCILDHDGRVAWKIENESDASLGDSLGDLPAAAMRKFSWGPTL